MESTSKRDVSLWMLYIDSWHSLFILKHSYDILYAQRFTFFIDSRQILWPQRVLCGEGPCIEQVTYIFMYVHIYKLHLHLHLYQNLFVLNTQLGDSYPYRYIITNCPHSPKTCLFLKPVECKRCKNSYLEDGNPFLGAVLLQYGEWSLINN